ncbi:hypothetical protein JTB14_024131 [Gonioctena quinquepunctata]|nr:hypothetical protein JTB14_024131 [Gonioctena quinquepunctata]
MGILGPWQGKPWDTRTEKKTQKEVDYRFSEEALQQAIKDVRYLNKTIRGPSTTYGVPRTTLKHSIRETRGKGKQDGGVKSYLTEQKELECIRVMEKMVLAFPDRKLWILLNASLYKTSFKLDLKITDLGKIGLPTSG